MLILLAAAAALGTAPFERGYGDWILVCDNIRTCTAKSAFDEAAEHDVDLSGLLVMVTRQAGPRETPAVDVSAVEDDDIEGPLRLDGRPIVGRASAGTLKGAEAAAFLRAIRNGAALTAGAGPKALGASLAGLSAALLAMDEAQGRVGGVTALARPGPRPAAAVPPPPPTPVVHRMAGEPPPLEAPAKLAAAVRRAKAKELKDAECDAARADTDEAEPLMATEAVVTLFCRMAAYQGPSISYRVPRDRPAAARRLILPPLPGRKASDDDGEYIDGGYDPKRATYSMSAKGRGLADCGVSASWTFDGRDFHLSSVSEQERCAGGDHEWPTTWVTREVVGP